MATKTAAETEIALQRMVTIYVVTGLLFLVLPGTFLGVWNLVQHLEGYKIDPKVMSTGEYVVTKDNLDDPKTRELFDPELQKQRKIEPPAFSK